MRIAYYINIDIRSHSGILKKVTSQIEIWKKNGHEVQLFCITNYIHKKSFQPNNENGIKIFYEKKNKIPYEKIKDFFNVESTYTMVQEEIMKYEPDIIYFRNDFYFPFFLKRLSRKNHLVAEINTDQLKEAKLRSKENIKGLLTLIYFRLFDPIFRKSLKGVVTVTLEISKSFSKSHKTKVVPNSTNFDQFKGIELTSHKSNPRVVFIGSPGMPWHGIDILEELSSSLTGIEIDIIGIDKIDTHNVTYHGFLSFEQYRPIINRADVCIGSLALFRNGMQEACPLKVREYLAFRKPIIIAYNDTAFEKYGYPEWVLKLPNSKQGILENIKEIETFVLKNKGYKIDLNEAKKYADANTIEVERINFFKEIVELS